MTLSVHHKFFALAFSILLIFSLTGCEEELNFGPDYSQVPAQWDTTGAERMEFPGGVVTYVMENVPEPANCLDISELDGGLKISERDRVLARYTGRNTDGEIFGSTYQSGLLGAISVNFDLPGGASITGITGLKIGLQGMVEGECRTVIVPPELGITSGQSAFRGDSLIIDFELVEILE